LHLFFFNRIAANSPENPDPMITVSKRRGCIGIPAFADISLDAECSDARCSDAHIFRLYQSVDCQCSRKSGGNYAVAAGPYVLARDELRVAADALRDQRIPLLECEQRRDYSRQINWRLNNPASASAAPIDGRRWFWAPCPPTRPRVDRLIDLDQKFIAFPRHAAFHALTRKTNPSSLLIDQLISEGL